MSAVLKAGEPSARYLEELRPSLVRQFHLLSTAPGGVARLRELILLLAVQGKLVPQITGEERAHEALQRVQAARERLITAGTIKAPRRSTDIADDGLLFEIPPSWAWVPLADVVRVLNGRAYSKQELLESGPTPVLRVGNLFTSNHWYYSDLELEPEKYCSPGELLFAWSASFGPFIWEGPKVIFHYHIWKLDPIAPKLFDSRYFHIFLREKTAEIKAAGHGVSMVHMTKEKMERIPVPWPPLPEQARIVARVEDLMRLCAALEAKGRLEAEQHARLLRTLLGTLTDSASPEELAANWQRVADHFDLLLDRPEAVDALEQTILQLAVRGLLVPQNPNDEPASVLLARIQAEKDRLTAMGNLKRERQLCTALNEDPPYKVPEGWTWAPVGKLGITVTGGTPPSNRPECFGDETPFIGPGQISPRGEILPAEKFVSQLGRLETSIAEQGDVLMVCIGGSIGKCALTTEATAFNQQINSIRGLFGSSNYLLSALSSPDFQQRVLDVATGSATPIISKGKWDLLLLPVPPPAEQCRIVARVAELRHLCTALRQRLAARQVTQGHLADALVEQAAA